MDYEIICVLQDSDCGQVPDASTEVPGMQSVVEVGCRVGDCRRCLRGVFPEATKGTVKQIMKRDLASVCWQNERPVEGAVKARAIWGRGGVGARDVSATF